MVIKYLMLLLIFIVLLILFVLIRLFPWKQDIIHAITHPYFLRDFYDEYD